MFATVASCVRRYVEKAGVLWIILGPAVLLAFAIASVQDDGIVRTVSSWVGVAAAALAYVFLPVRFGGDRRVRPEQRPPRSGQGGEQVIDNDVPAVLFQAALALTINQLDGIDCQDRTAEWFRSRMGDNLSALVDNETEASAREAVEKVMVLSR